MRRAVAGGVTLVVLLLLIAALANAAADGRGPAVRIAFLRGGDVYVLDAASGAETRLTTDGAADRLRWTSDGRLLFDTRGGTRRWRAGAAAEPVRAGVWAPDGQAVALAEPLPSPTPGAAVRIEEGGARPITPEEPWVNWWAAAWSPDGARLALARVQLGPSPVSTYSGPYPGEGALVLVDRAGGQRREVRLPTAWGGTVQGGWPDAVVWAPTGERLAVWVGPPNPCNSCRADGLPVVVVDARDGRIVPAGEALGPGVTLAWAPDGTFLVLSVPAGRETYVGKHLVRVDLPSGATRELARDPGWADTAPAVSPDGRAVAFSRGVALADGPPARPLRPDVAPTVAAIASRRLWLVEADGSSPRQLLDAPGWADEAPVWTPDGRWVVFVRWRPGPTQGVPGTRPEAPAAAELWAVRPDGTEARRLTALDLPAGFNEGFGFYGSLGWRGLFAVAPR